MNICSGVISDPDTQEQLFFSWGFDLLKRPSKNLVKRERTSVAEMERIHISPFL